MFGRLGWAEILVIVVLVVILFGHSKVPGMMKNLADGLNVFKKELKDGAPKTEDKVVPVEKKPVQKKKVTKKPTCKKVVQKKTTKKK